MRSRLRSSVVYIGLRMCFPSLLTSSSFIVFFLGRLTVTWDHRGSLDRVELAYLLDIGLPSVNSGGLKKFSPFHVPVTKSSDLDNLYENFKSSINFKIDRAVEIDLVSGNKTPEDAREEYCGAYTMYFEDCDLSSLISGLVLEILTELGLVFAQMCLNFLRHFLTLSVELAKKD
ncbi:hypothetical protein IGI04_019139 [Brassica rapa subsp. trilocularis]|uniref:Uncharacterized protein n=1 Tax=Brassica rapa subsp. trilocularis TaxID=1813537 RepID=A0ABQ7MFX1_BRACM|nr:hypothetical protein IGI04_019139 [Brassica rapa subsp. trilocularis]